jgi:hypothetical protein
MALLFLIGFVAAHVWAEQFLREFRTKYGMNLYIVSGPVVRDNAWTYVVWYFLGLFFFLMVREKTKQDMLPFMVEIYGFLVAYKAGAARALFEIERRMVETLARNQIAQGQYDPWPTPAAQIPHHPASTDDWMSPPPRMIDVTPVSRSSHDQRQSRPMSDAEWDDVQRQRDYEYQEWQNEERERTSRQAATRQPAPPVVRQGDGGSFDFDPARFKHRDQQPPSALPRGDQWQSPPRKNEERERTSRQPAPPAQAMPSFTYDGSRVWR